MKSLLDPFSFPFTMYLAMVVADMLIPSGISKITFFTVFDFELATAAFALVKLNENIIVIKVKIVMSLFIDLFI